MYEYNEYIFVTIRTAPHLKKKKLHRTYPQLNRMSPFGSLNVKYGVGIIDISHFLY